MKTKEKKSTKNLLSDKIADVLTIKPRADIEVDQVFGTKPRIVSRADISSSDSEEDAAISDFRKRSVNLLSDVNKKYEGQVVSRKDLEETQSDDIDDENDTVSENEISLRQRLISDEEDSEQQSKYGGTLISQDSESETDDESDESVDYSITTFQKKPSSQDALVTENESDQSDNTSDSRDDDDDEYNDDEEGYDISQIDEPPKEDFEHMTKRNISEETKKGICVRNQLLLWEGLLEMRIHVQRCINTANQMPMPDYYTELKQNKNFIEECNETKSNVATLLEKMLMLQNMLLKNNPETKSLAIKKQLSKEVKEETHPESDEEIISDTDNEEIPSDSDTENNIEENQKETLKQNTNSIITKKRKLEDYEKEMATSHKSFKSFRDITIQKWNDKTRLATAANIKNTPTNTILQQISYILSDRHKLLRRTQLKRSEYNIIGYKKPITREEKDQNGSEINPTTKDRKDDDEYIPEIFDDSDFYHQLLRELIECKSADISDPVQLSRQWIALQQMRSKMKRKVDTKATKGRKIKYVVHNQLVNYMAPEKCTTWNEESTNELYSSLFGKMFEQNNIGLNADLENNGKIRD